RFIALTRFPEYFPDERLNLPLKAFLHQIRPFPKYSQSRCVFSLASPGRLKAILSRAGAIWSSGDGSQFGQELFSLMSIKVPQFPTLLCTFLMFFSLCCRAAVPTAGHVVVVVEENQSYSDVIGNSSMPYLNALARQYGLATQYYANTHSSIGNYFMLTTGATTASSNGTVSGDNIVRHLLSAGKTWKAYAEGLPSPGYTGGDVYPYTRQHNPFTYFSDVVNSNVQRQNLLPMTQFSADLANGTLPNYSFVVPNVLHDGQNGALNQADQWLQANIKPLLKDPGFQQDRKST